MVEIEAFDIRNFMPQAVKLKRNRTPTVGLGIQKIEGSKIPNVIDQTNRVGQTDQTHPINPCIGCSSD